MNKIREIIIRYAIAFLPFIFFNQIYWFLKYSTFHVLSSIFSLFTKTTVNFEQNLINVNGQNLLLIEPCIAVSAFILLFLLNITSLDIKFKDRAFSLILSLALLFVFNILRILFLFSILNFGFFDTIHLIVWYGISTIFVFLDWILMVRIFKIKTIPVVSDIMYLIFSIKYDIRKEKEREKSEKEPDMYNLLRKI